MARQTVTRTNMCVLMCSHILLGNLSAYVYKHVCLCCTSICVWVYQVSGFVRPRTQTRYYERLQLLIAIRPAYIQRHTKHTCADILRYAHTGEHRTHAEEHAPHSHVDRMWKTWTVFCARRNAPALFTALGHILYTCIAFIHIRNKETLASSARKSWTTNTFECGTSPERTFKYRSCVRLISEHLFGAPDTETHHTKIQAIRQLSIQPSLWCSKCANKFRGL